VSEFYEQLRKQFDRIIDQDKRRKRRTAFLLLAFHLLLVIGSIFYLVQRANDASVGWYPIQTEIVWVLWAVLAFSWLVHAAAVLLLIHTVVSDTVRESLMLLAARQSNDGASEFAEKHKRNEPETDLLYIADDGELQRARRR
jgi:hypothetical protein